jgi:hypothetical protein
MNARNRISAGCLALLILIAAGSVQAAGRVRLEIVSDRNAPITSQQEWMERLGAVGVTDLRIRAGRVGDQVGVETQGSETAPIYLVTGIITSRNQLVLPGGRYGPGDAAQVARWVDNLAQKGLPKKEEPRSAFGLTDALQEKARKDLAEPVGFSTHGLARQQAVIKIGRQLGEVFHFDRRLMEDDSDDKVAEELSMISCGTALACLLRPAGLGLAPSDNRGTVEYTVVSSKAGAELWPVGRPPEKPLPQVLPAMYESFNANVQDVPVGKVLDVLSKRLKIPFLLDHNALARHGIEPDKKKVNAPQARTTYNLLLRKILSQAGLKSEVRLDEAGTPLLWITTQKPIPPAAQ